MSPLFIVVVTLLVIGLVGLLICRARTDYSLVQSAMYLLCCLLVRCFWGTHVLNKLPIPRGQGALIAANHRSSVDPFFIQVSARGRFVHWMVAEEYFKIPVVGYLLKQTGAIPTTRAGSDTKATREAIRLAHEGGLVGVLPEGKINQTTDKFMLPVRPGAALIAMRAEVPIVPCYIEGAPFRKTFWSPFVLPARVRVRYGEPIPMPREASRADHRKLAEELTLQVVAELARLAGQDDFEPMLRTGPTKESTPA